MTQQANIYTEAWTNADTGEVIIREPYKVINWTKEGEKCLVRFYVG